MSKVKEIQEKSRRDLQRKALEFYKQGLTLRQVADIVGKSHEWVRTAINRVLEDEEKQICPHKAVEKLSTDRGLDGK